MIKDDKSPNEIKQMVNEHKSQLLGLLRSNDLEKLSREFEPLDAFYLTFIGNIKQCQSELVPLSFSFTDYFQDLIDNHEFTLEGLHTYINSLFCNSQYRSNSYYEFFKGTEYAIALESGLLSFAYTEINRMIPAFTDTFFETEDYVIFNCVPIEQLIPFGHELSEQVKNNELPEDSEIYFNERKPYKEVMTVSDYRVRYKEMLQLKKEKGADYLMPLPDYDNASETIKKYYWFIKPTALKASRIYS